MTELAQAVRALGWGVDLDSEVLAGSMSGAGVYRVRVDGHDAVLKVTGPGDWQRPARRELTFYRTLAGQVPVTTPALLRYADNDDLTALLLSAHQPARPARQWSRSEWLEVSGQLAALHRLHVPHEAPWVDSPWITSVARDPPVGKTERFWSQTEARHTIGAVLDDPPALAAALEATPRCFVHGDCHVDNLLRDGSQVVWVDWQVAGIGIPAVDLAFLWGRANSDGADLPYDEMLDEYVTHSGIDRDLLRHSLTAAELIAMLYGWPDYATFHSQDEQDRVIGRIVQLIADWADVTGRRARQRGG